MCSSSSCICCLFTPWQEDVNGDVNVRNAVGSDSHKDGLHSVLDVAVGSAPQQLPEAAFGQLHGALLVLVGIGRGRLAAGSTHKRDAQNRTVSQWH